MKESGAIYGSESIEERQLFLIGVDYTLCRLTSYVQTLRLNRNIDKKSRYISHKLSKYYLKWICGI